MRRIGKPEGALPLLGAYLAAGERVPVRDLAMQLGISRGCMQHNLSRLVDRGVIVRIGFSRYVWPSDDRAAVPVEFGQSKPSEKPVPDSRPRPMPHVVPGVTLARLMAGR